MTKIIMANSFRGGTGKSTIISNIASYLSTYGMKVMIIDADIISPGIHAIFGLKEGNFSTTLTDYIKGRIEIEEAVYDISETLDLPENMLYIVPSSMNKGDIAELMSERVNYDLIVKGLPKLKKAFNPDYILIDTHPGINRNVLLSSDKTDIVLNVVRPDNQDYQGIEVYSQIMKKLRMNSYLILNKVHQKLNNKSFRKEIENRFKIPVAGILPLSEDVILSQSSYIMSDRYPDNEFSLAIREIGANVFNVKPKEHIEIMYELLNGIKKSADLRKIKTIPVNRIDNYLVDMEKERYLAKDKDALIITTKGEQFIKKYGIITRFINDFRL